MAALSGLPRRLVEQNIISPQQAQEIFAKAKEDKTHFVGAAVSMGKVKPRVLALMASEEFGIPFLDLTAFEIELMPQDIVNKELIEKHRVLPLFKRRSEEHTSELQSRPHLVCR